MATDLPPWSLHVIWQDSPISGLTSSLLWQQNKLKIVMCYAPFGPRFHETLQVPCYALPWSQEVQARVNPTVLGKKIRGTWAELSQLRLLSPQSSYPVNELTDAQRMHWRQQSQRTQASLVQPTLTYHMHCRYKLLVPVSLSFGLLHYSAVVN